MWRGHVESTDHGWHGICITTYNTTTQAKDMNHRDRNAHAELVATARGMYPRNVPVRHNRRSTDYGPYAYVAMLLALAAMLWGAL